MSKIVMPPDYVLLFFDWLIDYYLLNVYAWRIMAVNDSAKESREDWCNNYPWGGLMIMNNKNIIDAANMVEATRLKEETYERQ